MDVVERFVQKYASTDYKSVAEDALAHQFNDLVVPLDPNGKPSECEELKEEVYHFVECNNELHDRLDECEVRCKLREQSVAALEQKEAGKEHIIASLKNSIQDRTNLCQILGKLETGASPISLSNRLEAVVAQYNLGNRDACALLCAWLPLQLCEKLQHPVGSHKGLSTGMISNWGNTADRMRELQQIMGGRDTRGTNALNCVHTSNFYRWK
ncbi:posterior protein-like [Pyxicephalus adspersus]|uniref:posterior protein-like n=1 Tax=Pyxicephalus adspersus TaxID=30357 RepID=UPI003B59812F